MITEEFKNRLADNYSGPHGYVIITDKSGKILVNKPNMILKNGRDFLYYLFKKSIFPGLTDQDFDGYSLSSAIFTNETREVSFDDGVEGNPYILEIPFGNILSNLIEGNGNISQNSDSSVYITDETIEGHNALKFSFTIDSEKLKSGDNAPTGNIAMLALSSLYLVLTTNGNNNSNKYFSRIVFDSIPVETLEELSISYYVYF